MPKMRVVQIPRPKGPFEIVEREIPEPTPGSVRKVQACGICHTDSLTKEGMPSGIQYPRLPGHQRLLIGVRVGRAKDPRSTRRNPARTEPRPTSKWSQSCG
jgi:D-arabinose 1-dehydrogenase-like Zn-dependent alcohol dehydrogenase